ncbi:polyhydroxyalkanoate depolymerase [Thioclava sp. SK-1]|uniref:polyhydroxyalkanoate depolymerase n=1 Tax=Thioclava sp. SK-1 TaxID=1889770 RepID=UPI000826DD26|nr:polyhydroxyalkanoate depolymerase [Thioclava sp. SK-1]OCX64645.1 polyhydroxyalkanoate depolymerase [Thioclava sp. SK-1]
MKAMSSYDLMESIRNTNEWLGASARAMASYPVWGLSPNPMFRVIEAWGAVTERSFSRMVVKPEWNIPSITGTDGRDHLVQIKTIVDRPFGSLIHFDVQGRGPMPRRVLVVAPMSGHYATLLRSTVASLLPDAEVYITDWHNARDIPVSVGKFDVEDYTLYLADFMRELGSDINVIAVCQPAPLALAATAYLAEEDPDAQPRTLTLIGGPIDPDAAATDVTDFGRRITMGQLEQMVIQRVGFKYNGVGRLVYPGLMQLASFISMNSEKHSQAFHDKIMSDAQSDNVPDVDKHNKFYDEYLAVMDMTAEFYLSTVERIFKGLEIAQNKFTIKGKPVDLGKITSVAVKTVEGENDDISAPGQCVAALDLCTGVPDAMKAQHLEPGAGHYGIFAGGSWRNNIRPLVLEFIDEHADGPKDEEIAGDSTVTPMRRRAPVAKKATGTDTSGPTGV